jgi:ribosome biogenesis protein UTP30
MCLIADETNPSQKYRSLKFDVFVVFLFLFYVFVIILAENLLRSIDWIPQRLGVQFSASHGGSLTGTTGYFHERAFAISVSNTTTEEQTANGTSEGTIFRRGLSSIYERFSFLIASSISKLITSVVVLCLTFTLQLFVLLDHMSGLPIFYMASGWYEDWHSVCEICGICFQVKCMPN